MSEKKNEGLQEKKKPGRKAMTPKEKEAAAEKAKADQMKPELILQYQGADMDLGALTEAAKADFRAQKKRTLITSLKLYIKPEEQTAYYVVNEEYTGSVTF